MCACGLVRERVGRMDALLRRWSAEGSKLEQTVEDRRLVHKHSEKGVEGMTDARVPGNRRMRRIVNECVLREVCGPLNPDDMYLLFRPVPFGEVHDSTFTKLSKNNAARARYLAGGQEDKTTTGPKGEQHASVQAEATVTVAASG